MGNSPTVSSFRYSTKKKKVVRKISELELEPELEVQVQVQDFGLNLNLRFRFRFRILEMA